MSNSKKIKNNLLLDFDEWMVLAKNNPDEFEEKRREHIKIFFENIRDDKQHRLKGLQWRIDQTRKLSKTPMASCIEIYNMMWDSAERLKEHQYELVNLTLGLEAQVKTKKASATILKIDPTPRL